MTKLLQNMNWQEAREAFKGTKVAIIPTGSTEQHGPHLPIGTDFLIADYISKKVAGKANAIVTPVIPVGFAVYHTDFEGSLSVPTDILSSYYLSIADSLIKYGITHILFINGHGGNGAALNDVCRNLRDRGITAAYIQWWDVAGGINHAWSTLGHGDIVETSIMLKIAPESVDMSKAQNPVNKKLTDNVQILDGSNCKYKDGVVRFYLRMKDTTDNGGIYEYGHSAHADYNLSVKDATAENGEAILNCVVDYIVDFIDEFNKITFKPEI